MHERRLRVHESTEEEKKTGRGSERGGGREWKTERKGGAAEKEESASVDLRLLETEPDTQVSVQIFQDGVCACLASADHNNTHRHTALM